MKIVAIRNTVIVVVAGQNIPLVTLNNPKSAMKAVKWTRKYESAVEGATALLDYCKGHGLKPKGRKIAKKYCPALSGLRADYR
ncbi:MAG: hypothetical protein U9R15_04525 [Chloroflexota bacterium]|nr:hypothetical protein [Chloroflexota bacterium]